MLTQLHQIQPDQRCRPCRHVELGTQLFETAPPLAALRDDVQEQGEIGVRRIKRIGLTAPSNGALDDDRL
jgi:hypothetical protein